MNKTEPAAVATLTQMNRAYRAIADSEGYLAWDIDDRTGRTKYLFRDGVVKLGGAAAVAHMGKLLDGARARALAVCGRTNGNGPEFTGDATCLLAPDHVGPCDDGIDTMTATCRTASMNDLLPVGDPARTMARHSECVGWLSPVLERNQRCVCRCHAAYGPPMTREAAHAAMMAAAQRLFS